MKLSRDKAVFLSFVFLSFFIQVILIADYLIITSDIPISYTRFEFQIMMILSALLIVSHLYLNRISADLISIVASFFSIIATMVFFTVCLLINLQLMNLPASLRLYNYTIIIIYGMIIMMVINKGRKAIRKRNI